MAKLQINEVWSDIFTFSNFEMTFLQFEGFGVAKLQINEVWSDIFTFSNFEMTFLKFEGFGVANNQFSLYKNVKCVVIF